MTRPCDRCAAPIAPGAGITGRPGLERSSKIYCCVGCLSLGERAVARVEGPWIRLAVGMLLAAQSMALGLAINVSPPTGPERPILQGIVLAATLVVAALLGGPLSRAAWVELRRGRPAIEVLFVAGIVGSMAVSLSSMIRGRGPIYLEVVSVLLVVYSLGKGLTARSRSAAIAATRAWSSGLGSARRVVGDDVEVIPVASIRPGDLTRVEPGEPITVDGEVIEGTAFVRESALTGEAAAIVRRPGDRVWAGTVVEDGGLVIRATAEGLSRRVDALIAAVERARNSPTSLQGHADRLAAVFVPLVLGVSLLTFAYWSMTSTVGTGLLSAMAVLLVACPCSLGLATPIAVWSALDALARRGLIAADGRLVERLAAVDRVVFDKTGTLTEGRSRVVDLAVDGDRELVLGLVAAVAARSDHPVARALRGEPDAMGPGMVDLAPLGRPYQYDGWQVDSIVGVPGAGVVAEVRVDGTSYAVRIGRGGWIDGGEALASQLIGRGGLTYVEIDGRVRAVAAVDESLRGSSIEAIDALRALGLPVEVMTGDAPGRAEALGLPAASSGMSPEAKGRSMAEGGGRTLYVGDGINDGPALASAFAGIALAEGSAMAAGAASATLDGGDLRAIPEAIVVCRRAVGAIRSNLLLASAYNLAGMGLAASGNLHPVAAALLMGVSSAWVSWRSLRAAEGGDCRVVEASGPRLPVDAAAGVHGVALAAQGLVLSAVAGLDAMSTVALCVAFAASAVALSTTWRRWASIPHDLDMAFGMLTLGNLGMLIGWWLDGGRPGCCEAGPLPLSTISTHPGMWLGMLLGGNAAMGWLGRRSTRWPIGVWVAGNLGMAAGMLAGGRLGSRITPSPLVEFPMMGLGMAAGMALGHAISAGSLARHVLCMMLPPVSAAPAPSARDHRDTDEDQHESRPRPARRHRGALRDSNAVA